MGMWKGYHFRAGLCSGGWCRGRGDGGRRSRSVERGCSWGCLNCSAPHSLRELRPQRTAWAGDECRAVIRVPCCRPAGRVSCQKGHLLGKDRGWRLLGR